MSFRSVAPQCPACEAILEDESLFEVRALHCKRCGGAWFDALAPDPVVPGARHRRNEAPHERPCPRCEHELRSAFIGPATMLACKSCGGGFLPRDSFAALLAEPRARGTMPPPRQDHVRVLAVVRALARRPLEQGAR